VSEQVFGPDRPAAARAALFELDQAKRAAAAWCGFGPDAVYERLREAKRVRAMYSEYADTPER
jgi:hypothetical protein